MAGNSAESGRTTLSRAVALLSCFTVEARELRLAELSELSGLPRSTTHRIAEELVEVGAMIRCADGSYAVALHLWNIASSSPSHRQLRDEALPLLADLYEATRETAQLAVLDGLSARILDKVTGPASAHNVSITGGELPLHATGVGKVLLAYSSPDLLVRVVEAGLEPRTRYTIVQPGRLAAHVAKVRETSLGWAREEMTLGVCSVAAPIRTPEGVLHGAIGVVAKSSSVNLDRAASAVRMAGLSIGRRLG